jgi:cyclin H
MKRFYITNSVMSYHPRSIMITALFLATKIEHQHISARNLASKLNNVPSLESITAEDIPAPEFILTQGLLFNLDIRHPHRALKGAFIELQMLLELMKASSIPQGLENLSLNDNGPAAVRAYLIEKYNSPEALSNRAKKIYHRANDTLKTEAVLSDAYFLYTPPQIVLAALLLADEELALDLYKIRMKKQTNGDSDDSKDLVLETARSCASLLRQAGPAWRTRLGKTARAIDRKLHFCRNPEKADLVERHKAQKRDATVDGKLDEGLAKKRRLEREKNEKEADDLFGPSLVKN